MKYTVNIKNRIRPMYGLALILLAAVSTAAGAGTQSTGISQPAISGALGLGDAVQTALKYSPMVQSAGAMASAAQARVGMARAMTQPQLSVSAFGGTSSMGDIVTAPQGAMQPATFSVPGRAGVTGQASLMYPLYTGGRLSSAVKSAQSLSNAASQDSATVERNTALEVKMAYHKALLTRATVDAYKNLVREEEERVRTADAAFREGRIAKYDLLRNQSGLAEAKQQLSGAERDARIAMTELKTVLGVSPDSDITLSDELAYRQVEVTPEAYMQAALRNRPEAAAARARTASAEAGIAAARGAYKPQVYAGAMVGVNASGDGRDTGATVGITVGLPILDGGLRRSAVQESESMRDAAKHEEQQVVLAVQQDVNTVLAEIQAADKNVQLSQAAVEQADEDYRVIKLRYEAGKAVNVEVLDALASLVRAQNNRLAALYEHNIAGDRLARSTGEL